MLNLSDLRLSQAVLEVRHETAYQLWDYSGRLWASVARIWPNLVADTVQPNLTTFHLDNRYQLSISMDKAYILDTIPTPNLQDFIEKANDFIKIIIQFLNIEYFKRIGFRLVYEKYFQTKEEAAAAMLSTKMIMVPEGPHFAIKGKVSLPKYSIRLEGESIGARILLEAREKKVDFDAPPGMQELTSIHITKNILAYDIDYFTLSPVSTGQLNIIEWLKQSYHLIKRDSKSFLGSV